MGLCEVPLPLRLRTGHVIVGRKSDILLVNRTTILLPVDPVRVFSDLLHTAGASLSPDHIFAV